MGRGGKSLTSFLKMQPLHVPALQSLSKELGEMEQVRSHGNRICMQSYIFLNDSHQVYQHSLSTHHPDTRYQRLVPLHISIHHFIPSYPGTCSLDPQWPTRFKGFSAAGDPVHRVLRASVLPHHLVSQFIQELCRCKISRIFSFLLLSHPLSIGLKWL